MTPTSCACARGLRSVGRALATWPRAIGLVMAVAWMALIWSLSAMEGEDGPRNFLASWFFNAAHAPFYGVLAVWLVVALPRRDDGWPRIDARAVALVLGVVVAYALIDEWHQGRVPGRDPDALDILTDVVGAGATLWMIRWLGSDAAERGGTWRRLAVGTAACFLSALAATWRSWV